VLDTLRNDTLRETEALVLVVFLFANSQFTRLSTSKYYSEASENDTGIACVERKPSQGRKNHRL